MSVPHRDPAPDPESKRLNYELLFLRWQSAQSAVFAVLGFCIAVQGALFVGMLSLELSGAATLLFGLGLLMVSGTASLVVRFYELSAMLDRQMLERLEADLRLDGSLRLRHGLRLEKRFADVMATGTLSESQKSAARKRRTSKGGLGESAFWARTDKVLTALGQPTIVFTAVLAMVGVVGVATSVARASSNLGLGLLAGSLTLVVLVGPWVLATESGPVRSLRGSP